MSDNQSTYHHLAALLSYPGPDYVEHVSELRSAARLDPELSLSLDILFAYLTENEASLVEQLYTETFDMNPDTCLEVGWHLFGEDYKRGEFLVRMRESLRGKGLLESVELPDHISHCLRLLVTLDPEDAEAMARSYLLPAIEKILKGFNRQNPFHALLEILHSQLETDFGRAATLGPNPARASANLVQISS